MFGQKSRPAAEVWNAQAAAHLLSRAAFGATPEAVARLTAMTREQAVDALLDETARAPQPARPAWVRDVWINTERRWADTPREVAAESHRLTGRRHRQEVESLRGWWLDQMIHAATPLTEVMALFWHGHFCTAVSKVNISQALYQQNATLRRHALGNFRALVGDVLLDPAMMMYLDLEDSRREQPNENLARELCELFTLGVGNYAEQDVREIARALSGWTLDAPPGTAKKGQDAPGLARGFSRDGLVPRFIAERHDAGRKTVLGQSGNFGLAEVADLVAAHPATARFIAGKLIGFFGAADPEGRLQTRLAAAFNANRDSATQLKAVLRALFTAPEFYSTASRGSQIKSPVRLLVGACRQLRLEVEPTPNLARLTAAMGQTLFDPPNVKGWAGGKTWIGAGTLAVRYHLAEALLDSQQPAGLEALGRTRPFALARDAARAQETESRIMASEMEAGEMRAAQGIKIRFTPQAIFPGGPPDKPAALVDELTARLLARPARRQMRAALIDAAASGPPDERVTMLIRLILASPEYQMA